MVSDVTALALGLTDQRLAKPNGEFCKAFLEVTRMLAQIQRWAVVRNNLKWRENVFWLTDSMFHILLAPLLWAWAEEEHRGGESMGRKRLLTSAERQEEGARDKGWPAPKHIPSDLGTPDRPQISSNFQKRDHKLATGHVELFSSSKSV